MTSTENVFAAIPTATVTENISAGKAVRDTATLARRGLLKFKHSPQLLVDVIIVPIIYTVLFGSIFGGVIAGDVTTYLPTLIPGVLVNVAITSTVVVGIQLREDIDKGILDRFVSMPISRIAPLAGGLVAANLRYLIAVVITVGAGVAMGYRPASPLGVLASAALVVFSAFALSWVFALLGVALTKASAVQGFSALLLTILGFTSNAFVPTSTLPGWLRPIAEVNPLSQLISAVRLLANEGQVDHHLVYSVLGSLLIMAIATPLTVRIYLRKL
ncbi:ABC transporter permease [Williamsia phyllosphaerae]|uniref:Transport permease protein n=1 Tax=Williamsia phyllosphaerae TaxID=885042 RepID=A0ABQ1V0C2_9NOCA|nr:ABC transporter permease [Williamsia phyllosphaerae]GGF31351.1 transport permease protein [Williamsia phyllosphaerae]